MTMQALFWVLRLLKAASDAGLHRMQRCIQKVPASSYICAMQRLLDAEMHRCITLLI